MQLNSHPSTVFASIVDNHYWYFEVKDSGYDKALATYKIAAPRDFALELLEHFRVDILWISYYYIKKNCAFLDKLRLGGGDIMATISTVLLKNCISSIIN